MLLKVVKIIRETKDTVTIRFNHKLDFTPGQFIMIYPIVKGKKLQRSYSISNSPTENWLEITIKIVPKGLVSIWANEELKVGDEIEVKGPFGRAFLLDEKAKEIVMMAAGSGVVPFRSMLGYILDKNLPIKVTLLDSNKTPGDIIFRKELKGINMDKNINIIHTITRANWPGRKGRIDAKMIREEVGDFKGKLFYLCGSTPFVENMLKLLLSLGAEKSQIRREGFGG